MINKTLLSSAAVILAVAGAQAADLPSKKAAPATYVKICDAYGAGFFYIPGSDTCVKVGGYVRAEYQYVPGKDTAVVTGNSATASSISFSNQAVNGANTWTLVPGTNVTGVPAIYYRSTGANNPNYTLATSGVAQRASAMSETGAEIRGRIDVDARTPTAMGAARTFIRLRAANTSGIRNTTATNNGIWGEAAASTTGISIESAMVQWAGFTFGVAPENYAMMPSQIYNANPWAGFPNGMKQIAYTATLGGGLSATVALEDKSDFGYSSGPSQGVYLNKLTTAANIVANLRLDQAWGFAAVHGMIGNNSLESNFGFNPNATGTVNSVNTNSLIGAGALGYADAYTSSFVPTPVNPSGTAANYGTISAGQSTFGGYAVGATVNFKLPMIAAGDQVWFTANYAHGMTGALLSGGGLSTMASASAKRILGGIIRVDQNLVLTGGNGTAANPYTVGSTNGWNVAMAATHYWTANWRSNFSAGYVEINPPTSTATATDALLGTVSLPQWGKGKLWEVAGSIIYSPAKDFDIGLEVQYANLKNNVQNTATAVTACGASNGANCALAGTAMAIPSNFLNSNNITTKLRIERTF